jgi:hypothetical protein
MQLSKKMLGIMVLAAAAGIGSRAVADDAAAGAATSAAAPAAAPASVAPAGQMAGEQGEGGKGGKFAAALGLSDDQLGQFRSEEKQHREAMKALMEKGKAGFEKLAGQVEAKAGDDELKATLDSLEGVKKDREAEDSRHIAALKALLNPTQQAKVLLRDARRMMEEMKSMGKAEGGAPDAGASK